MTPLNEQAYNYLQKLIMENHFSYQEVYSETKLSKELGISRTPLRDAVHRLAQEGYIDIIPSKGFMLHQMNRKDVNETFQVRSALETYCTVQISKASSTRKAKKLFKELDWIMECMNDIMETTHSIKEFSDYDLNKEAVADVVAAGAKEATYAEIGEQCGRIIIMVPSGAISKSILFDEDGVASTIKEGTVVCDMSSVTPAFNKFFAIGLPMIPSPINPTFIFIHPFSFSLHMIVYFHNIVYTCSFPFGSVKCVVLFCF